MQSELHASLTPVPTSDLHVWRSGVESLSPAKSPCPGLYGEAWQKTHANMLDFSERFGAQAVELGWTASTCSASTRSTARSARTTAAASCRCCGRQSASTPTGSASACWPTSGCRSAIRIVADDETGELENATILGQFGEVPDDFAESLQG